MGIEETGKTTLADGQATPLPSSCLLPDRLTLWTHDGQSHRRRFLAKTLAKIRLVARADEKSERERATGKRVIRKEGAHGREKTREEGGWDAKCNCVFGFEGERAKCRRHLFVGVGAENQPYLSVTDEIDRGRLLSPALA